MFIGICEEQIFYLVRINFSVLLSRGCTSRMSNSCASPHWCYYWMERPRGGWVLCVRGWVRAHCCRGVVYPASWSGVVQSTQRSSASHTTHPFALYWVSTPRTAPPPQFIALRFFTGFLSSWFLPTYQHPASPSVADHLLLQCPFGKFLPLFGFIFLFIFLFYWTYVMN